MRGNDESGVIKMLKWCGQGRKGGDEIDEKSGTERSFETNDGEARKLDRRYGVANEVEIDGEASNEVEGEDLQMRLI